MSGKKRKANRGEGVAARESETALARVIPIEFAEICEIDDDEKSRRMDLSVGDAMCEAGFGPMEMARALRGLVVARLAAKPDEDKLLLETLKECGRHLDPGRVYAAGVRSDERTVVLEHEVARPKRDAMGFRAVNVEQGELSFHFGGTEGSDER